MPYNDLRKGRYSEAWRAYSVTMVLAHRTPYFADFRCARLAIGQMRQLHDDGELQSLAWVVMPDHVHWLLQLGADRRLSDVIKCFKARTAQQVNGYLHRRGALWQKAFYDHALRDNEDIRGIARYIIANPLRAGLATHIGEYPHWDAIWL